MIKNAIGSENDKVQKAHKIENISKNGASDGKKYVQHIIVQLAERNPMVFNSGQYDQ